MKKNNQLILLTTVLLFCQTASVFGWTLQQAPVMTPWAYDVDPSNPLPEYPRPQMVRDDWMNLNGVWQMQPGSAGDPVPTGQTLSGDILVPFPVESAISGVMQHYERLWYRRHFDIPAGWDGQRVLLHFGAVDWETEVYVNGASVGIHKGGYDAFSFDITGYLNGPGMQELIVRVFDPTDAGGYARGKQTLYPGGIMYTPTTGIWQTVWLEPVPQVSVTEIKLVPDVDNKMVKVTGFVSQSAANLTIEATAYDNGVEAGTVTGAAGQALNLTMHNPKLWSPDNPFLYDLTVVLKQGDVVIDQVDSYFGMRKIALGMDDGIIKMLLNDEFVFQMGPLDQGFWPDGIYTAPTDEALKYDLEMTKAFGFNMTRKHIKVEPARWYYWADKLGLMVWQDMPSTNSYTGNPQPIDVNQFKTELTNMVQTHWNHPSIIMWVIYNEFQGIHDTELLCDMVKSMDPTRLVNPNSGEHRDNHDDSFADVFDIHSYPPPNYPISDIQARACGEYGGIGMAVPGHMYDEDSSWGYGSNVESGEELAARYDSYSQMLGLFKGNYGLSAAVYTQITDVEIEVNGLMTYDRVIKTDPSVIAVSNQLYSRTYDVVLETSQQTPQTWRYTTDEPVGNWYAVGFDDTAWSEGSGGFGAGGPPGAVINTPWSTSDIWLRQTFNLGTLTPEEMEKLVWMIHHDEDAEVYINGVPAFGTTGYTTSYIPVQMSETAKSLLIQNAVNTIAVHCHQTGGGQYIDVGLSLETLHMPTNCGKWGYPPADLDRNCQVNLNDLVILTSEWMNCSTPDQINCTGYLIP